MNAEKFIELAGRSCGLAAELSEDYRRQVELWTGKLKRAALPEHFAALILTDDTVDFLAQLNACLRLSVPVFLGSKRWGQAEWDALRAMGNPLPLDALENQRPEPQKLPVEAGIYIPTGGSSGRLRFARHSVKSLIGHAEAFIAEFGAEASNSLNLLPPYHVSGLMPWVRAVIGGGKMRVCKFEQLLSAKGFATLTSDEPWSLSLVPTQLNRLLNQGVCDTVLRGLGRVFIGGGPASADLLARGAAAGIPLTAVYGMTETASMIAAGPVQRDGSFSLRPLPHAKLAAEDASGAPKSTGQGILRVKADSLCSGLFPSEGTQNPDSAGWYRTGDRVEIFADGGLRILGRADRLILSGGEKIDPGEIESTLFVHPTVANAYVFGVEDADWGERCVALVEPAGRAPDLGALQAFMRERLPSHKLPKTVKIIEKLPRNALGKIDRQACQALIHDLS